MLQKGLSHWFFFVVLFIGLQNNGYAQPCINSIQGRVNSFSEHLPVAFASVYLIELKLITTTDSLGKFQFCNIPNGKWKLIVKQLGFDSLQIEVEPEKKRFTIHLKENQQWLDAIDVRGQHRHFDSEVVESQSLHKEELERNRGISLGELASKIPGVSMLHTGPTISKPVIQGLTGQRIAIVNDGVKIEGQQWGFDHAPETDPNVADEITVVKGAQAVRFGSDAIGGVILLEPGEIITKGKWNGKSTTGFATNGRTLFQNLMVQKSFGPNEKGAIRLSINGKKGGDLSTAKYVLGNTAMDEASTMFLARYTFGKLKAELSLNGFATRIGIFSGSHISSPEGIRNAFKRPDSTYNYTFGYGIDRPRQSLNHGIAKAKLTYELSKSHKFQILYNHQIDNRKEFDIIRKSSSCPDCPQLIFQLQSQQLELNHTIKKEGFDFQSGLVGLKQENVVERSILIPNFRLYQASGYGIASWYRGNWAFESGFRVEFRQQQIFRYVGDTFEKPIHFYLNTMANTGLRYQINDHWHTKLNLQFSQRAPNVNELYSNGVHHGTASFEKGDPNLKQEQIWNASYSLHHRSEKWEVLVNLFETYSPNFIYLAPFADSIITTIRGPFPFFSYQSSEINMRGMDFFVDFQAFRNVSFYGKGAFIRSWNFSRDSYLIYQPADRLDFGLELKKEWNNSGLGFVFRFGPQWVSQQYRAPNDQDFADAPPGYMLWSAACALRKSKGKFRFDLSAEGQNLENIAYRDYMNRFRYFGYDLGRNFRIRLTIPLGTG